MDSATAISTGKQILIMDDDDMLRTRLVRAFQVRGYGVVQAASYDEAVDLLHHQHIDFAVVDLNLPGRTGLDFLKTVEKVSPSTRSVVVTGYGSIVSAVEAIKHGAHHYLTKPADADEILAALLSDDPSSLTDSSAFKPQTLAETEWEHIHRILSETGDNISEAARRLGIPRRTLQRKLKKRAP